MSSKLQSKVKPKDFKHLASTEPIKVESFRELTEHVAHLAYINKDHLLFFRGQSVDFKNTAENSTYYPSIYRKDRLDQKELDHRFKLLNNACKALVDKCVQEKVKGVKEIKRKKYIQWSLLQHYEVCHTPLLDFSHSLRVACSFALIDNQYDSGYLIVFGLPFLTNRISINSEHDLVVIRLLSISPPEALRPYFQEGYLAGTSDITDDYDNKTELDFNNRLIAKFQIPNTRDFWGRNFSMIPKDALYPKGDGILDICNEIKAEFKRDFHEDERGDFLKDWSDIEENLIKLTEKKTERASSIQAVKLLYKEDKINSDTESEIFKAKKLRDQVVLAQTEVSSDQLKLVKNLKNQLSNIRVDKIKLKS